MIALARKKTKKFLYFLLAMTALTRKNVRKKLICLVPIKHDRLGKKIRKKLIFLDLVSYDRLGKKIFYIPISRS
jgi:hypothetical protein